MASGTDSYATAKVEQLDDTATVRVYGRALDFDMGDAARRWKPVMPCLCVHDSPDNPCPCPKGVWWLRSDMILAEGDAGRQDHDGNDLRYFDVLVESQILVESVQPVNAGRLKELSKYRDPAEIEEVIGALGAGGGIGTAAGKGSTAAKIFWAIVSELFYDALTDMPPSDNTKTWAEYCREHPENPFCKGIS